MLSAVPKLLDLFDLAADPCRRRHRGNPNSTLAHDKVRPCKGKVHAQILELARSRGRLGVTLHDVAAALGKDRSTVSPRLTELKAIGQLIPLCDDLGREVRRDGAAVLVIPEQ